MKCGGWFSCIHEDLEITELIYYEVDKYMIQNRCKKCGFHSQALIQYPRTVIFHCGERIRLPDIKKEDQ